MFLSDKGKEVSQLHSLPLFKLCSDHKDKRTETKKKGQTRQLTLLFRSFFIQTVFGPHFSMCIFFVASNNNQNIMRG